MMQIILLAVLFVNINKSVYCSRQWAESQGVGSAKVSSCSQCGTNVAHCGGSGFDTSSTCMIYNGQCVDDPERSLFNPRHTLRSEKRPEECSEVDKQFKNKPGRNKDQAYMEAGFEFTIDGVVGTAFEFGATVLDNRAGNVAEDVPFWKNKKAISQVMGCAGAFAGPVSGMVTSMVLESFMEDPMQQRVDFVESAVECNKFAIEDLQHDVKELKTAVQHLRTEIDNVWEGIHDNRDEIHRVERQLEDFTLTQMTVENIEHIMDFQLVMDEMTYEIQVLMECLQHPSHGNCKDEDLSPVGGARFTRVYEHGMAVNNIIATWFDVTLQYKRSLLDLDWNGQNLFDDLVERATEHALVALSEWMTESMAFLKVFEGRGGYNVWEISAGPSGALTMLSKEMCGMEGHITKAKSFFEEFQLMSYYYMMTDYVHGSCEVMENNWKRVRATHQFFLTAVDDEAANHFFGRTDCSDASSTAYSWPPANFNEANIPNYDFGYHFGTDAVNFMKNVPGQFVANEDICGAGETEWVAAVHGSHTSAQLYELKNNLIDQSCSYQRFFACLEFVKFNFGYIERDGFEGFEYQSWETYRLQETEQEVYLRQNELREFMVEPKCASVNVVTNQVGYLAQDYSNQFELQGSYKINGEVIQFSCSEDVIPTNDATYQVRACGCIPPGAELDLHCEAHKGPGSIVDEWETHFGYKHIGYHIEINGEKFCLAINDDRDNGSTDPERQNRQGTDYEDAESLMHAYHTLQVRSWHEEIYTDYIDQTALPPIDPWCWKKWEDLDYENFGVSMNAGACGDIPDDPYSVNGYTVIYENVGTTCSNDYELSNTGSSLSITTIDECKAVCDTDSDCSFFFLNDYPTCITYAACDSTRSAAHGGTTWQKDGTESICLSASTENNGQYDIIFDQELGSSKAVTFTVQASNDAHIGFFSSSQSVSEMYEIVIGGWANSQSVIRKSHQGTSQATASTSNILSSSEARQFWASASNGLIRLGHGSVIGEQIILSWQDSSPHEAVYVGLMTGWGATGSWNVCMDGSDMTYGIEDGEIDSSLEILGHCDGQDGDVYVCGGTGNFIKWPLALGLDDFDISSEFKANSVSGTALSFVLWSGSTEHHIGLDGSSNTFFYSGGNWGSANIVGSTSLDPSQFQTIRLRRIGTDLTVTFADSEWTPLQLSVSIDAVGIRPWRNTVNVKNFFKYGSATVPAPVMTYGINDGQVDSSLEIDESCDGRDGDVYVCGGTGKFIKWPLALGTDDFDISSQFKANSVSATALSFVLWSGSTMYHIGLDGGSNRLFYEGGMWGGARFVGSTPLDPSQFQTIRLRRIGTDLTVTFADDEWDPLALSASIDAVGIRPWRNTVNVKNFIKHD